MRTASDLPVAVRDLVLEGREAWRARDYQRANDLFERALEHALEADDAFALAAAYHFLGNVAFNRCRDEDARRLHSLALGLAHADRDPQGVATSLGSLALVDVADGRLASARRRFAAAAGAYERAGMPDAAERVRGTAAALLDRHEPLGSLLHREPAAGA